MGDKVKKFSFISVILSVICVVFVAEAAAPAAAIGNQQFFWWIFLILTFPTGSATRSAMRGAAGWPGTTGSTSRCG